MDVVEDSAVQTRQSAFFFLSLSFLIVAFGQPAWLPYLGTVSSIAGFALFFRVLLGISESSRRFWVATIWFACVQMVQLSWFLTHPFSYVYGLFLFLTFGVGAQMGLFALLLTKERIRHWAGILSLASFWALSEWTRLFFLSGFSFNPIGIALTDSLYGLQWASLFGMYGLSFFIVLINLSLARAWIDGWKRSLLLVWAIVALIPFLFGFIHLQMHKEKLEVMSKKPEGVIRALLVQTAFPIEEIMPFETWEAYLRYTENEWAEIFKTIAPEQNKHVELIALPEYVVPFGTYMAVYPFERLEQAWVRYFGKKAAEKLPDLKPPLALEVEGKWHVTNAFICQGLSNLFEADLVAGLQDDQWIDPATRQSYSSGFYFWPGGTVGLRYEKQVLLPMAEYIPFEPCRKMAAEYGITGSFTCGTGAKVFPGCKAPFGISICYEETYGHLMRQNRERGAELLVNLSSDVWYPDSRLPKQHFDHARLRTVESGIPLIRSCNTGITGAINSLGEIVVQGREDQEWERFALIADVPLYHYRPLYSIWGDLLIIGFSLMALPGLWLSRGGQCKRST